jgi:predicted MFS family arabinose efflux permease
MVIFTVIFKPLVDSVGFPWTLRIIAFIILGGLLVSIAVLKQRPSPNKPRALIDVTAFREARFNIYSLAIFFMFIGAYVPFYYVPVYAQEFLGISESLAYDMLTVMAAGSIFGRIIPPFVALRYGALPVVSFLLLICGMLQFTWGAVDSLGNLGKFFPV